MDIVNQAKQAMETISEKASGLVETAKEKIGEDKIEAGQEAAEKAVANVAGKMEEKGGILGQIKDKAEELTGKDLDGDGTVGQ